MQIFQSLRQQMRQIQLLLHRQRQPHQAVEMPLKLHKLHSIATRNQLLQLKLARLADHS